MTYAMTFDNSWELMSEDEMYDVNGGSKSDFFLGVLASLVANALWVAGKWAINSGMVKTALLAVGSAAKVVWAGISAAVAWVWNTPVALAIVAGVVGITIGIIIAYYGLR